MTLPLVSIILPVLNESRTVRRCLEAVLAQDYPPERMEVLVVDGMSSDGTRAQVERLVDASRDFVVKLLDNPARIVPVAMNIGLGAARGEIIVRVDGHTFIAPDYVRNCVSALQRSGADNAGGRMCAVGENPFGRAVAIATSSFFGVGDARFHYSNREEWVDTVYLGAWHRQVFQRIGLFDEELVRDQDDEFNYRLRSRGGRILLDPRIRSTYLVRSTPAQLWKQYFQYGCWKVRVLQKHPRQMRIRQFIPLAFVLSLMLSGAGALIFPWGWMLIVLVAGSHLLINLVVSLAGAWKHGGKYFFTLPLCYAILHLSYGLGFLAGLVRFWRRWGDRRGGTPQDDHHDG